MGSILNKKFPCYSCGVGSTFNRLFWDAGGNLEQPAQFKGWFFLHPFSMHSQVLRDHGGVEDLQVLMPASPFGRGARRGGHIQASPLREDGLGPLCCLLPGAKETFLVIGVLGS